MKFQNRKEKSARTITVETMTDNFPKLRPSATTQTTLKTVSRTKFKISTQSLWGYHNKPSTTKMEGVRKRLDEPG